MAVKINSSKGSCSGEVFLKWAVRNGLEEAVEFPKLAVGGDGSGLREMGAITAASLHLIARWVSTHDRWLFRQHVTQLLSMQTLEAAVALLPRNTAAGSRN